MCALLTAFCIPQPAFLDPPAGSRNPSLWASLPAEHVAAYVYSPKAAGGQASGSVIGFLGGLGEQAARLGILANVDASVRVWIDVLLALGSVARFPHAVVLQDVKATPRSDGGHELAGLRAALLIQCGENRGEIERHIQHVLNGHTNNQQTNLTWLTRGGYEFTILRDRRLAEWVVIAWGRIEDRYLVTLGDGTLEWVLDNLESLSKSTAAEVWFNRASAELDALQASWAMDFRVDRIMNGADRHLAVKMRDAIKALRLDGVDRALLTVRRKDRAVVVNSLAHRGSHNEVTSMAGSNFRGRSVPEWIPDQASGYSILDCSPSTVVAGLADAYLAARSAHSGHEARMFWTRVQTESNVAIGRDILARLGPGVVIHDYPRHALALPLTWTVQIQVAAESPSDRSELRAALDRILEFAQREMAEAGGIQLARTPEGIWYLHFGLAGPALVLTDEWLIVSFSPEAVRQNVSRMAPLSPDPQP